MPCAAVHAVVCTSRWTRDWLATAYDVPAARLHVVVPGADKSPLAEGSATGDRLLSVGAITPVKGHDVLVSALASLADLRWTWSLVGASVDAEHATALWASLCEAGLDDRVTLAGALTGPDLAAAYGGADLLVLPSRHETYGIVASEALARGIPVLATDVGGVREALGASSRGAVPGLLVPSDDPTALAAALRDWLTSRPCARGCGPSPPSGGPRWTGGTWPLRRSRRCWRASRAHPVRSSAVACSTRTTARDRR